MTAPNSKKDRGFEKLAPRLKRIHDQPDADAANATVKNFHGANPTTLRRLYIGRYAVDFVEESEHATGETLVDVFRRAWNDVHSRIEVSQGKTALIDPQDYVKLAAYRWTFANGYAVNSKLGMMQRAILSDDIEPGMVVHHVNGDRLDNRRENLVATSPREHSRTHGLVKDTKHIGFTAPSALVDKIDAARLGGESRSDTLRRLLTDALA